MEGGSLGGVEVRHGLNPDGAGPGGHALAHLFIQSLQEDATGLDQLLLDGNTGSEVALPVLALEHLSDDTSIFEIVEHKIKSGHQGVAVSAEFGVARKLVQGSLGELGEQGLSAGVSVEKPN